jgi:hypothetical protein
MAKQFVVQLPNRPGALAELSETLASRGVDLRAIGGGGIGNVGHVILTTADDPTTKDVLDKGEYTYIEGESILAEVGDRPGGMARIARDLADAGVNELEQLVRRCLAARGLVQCAAALPDDRALEVGRDHAQPLGFHVEPDEHADVRVEPDLDAAPTAPVARRFLLDDQPLANHLIDEVADARVADVQEPRELHAAGDAFAVERAKQQIPLLRLRLGRVRRTQPEHAVTSPKADWTCGWKINLLSPSRQRNLRFRT